MTMQIQKIVLYNAQGKKRILDFKLGQMNVIVGSSNTGKSTVIQIVDYCLGRSDFDICDGVTRETVEWYAVLFKVNDLDVFVAKPKPQGGRSKQNRAYFVIDHHIVVPEFSELKAEQDDFAVTQTISRLLDPSVGLDKMDTEGHLTTLHVTVDRAAPFLFQEKTVIANNHVLFYRQQQASESIKDGLPYFLGIINQHDLHAARELEAAKSVLHSVKTRLGMEESRLSTVTDMEEPLVREAERLGMVDPTLVLETPNTKVQSLQSIVDRWQPTLAPRIEDDQLPDLREDLENLRRRMAENEEEIHSVESFMQDLGEYSQEKNEQLLRLESIEVFDAREDFFHAFCPLCNSRLDTSPPHVAEMRTSIEKLEHALAPEQRLLPDLQNRLVGLREEKDRLKQEIAQKSALIRSIIEDKEAQTEVVHQIVQQNSVAARTVGRIGLYLDLTRSLKRDSSLLRQVQEAEDRVRFWSERVDAESEGVQMAATLNEIGSHMTTWAGRLRLEHEGFYHLDLDRLTVVADKHNQPISMDRMGGRSNWLKCHLIALLGLHAHFVRHACPVPNFLILDQPAQVYFPSEKVYGEVAGRPDGALNSGADLDAVNRMFEFLFDLCADLGPDFQLIVLEHANLPMFREAMVDGGPWTQDHALIPKNWIMQAEQLSYL